MKSLLIVAAAACFAMPAAAQDWAGTPLAPTSITGISSGVDYDATSTGVIGFANQGAQGLIYPQSIYCSTVVGGQLVNSPQPCAPGARKAYTNSGQVYLTDTLPAAATQPDAILGVAVYGAYKDSSALGGVSVINAFVPLSTFQRAGVNSVDTAAINARFDALQADIDASRSQLAAVQAEQQALIDQANRNQQRLVRGVALASSLNLLSPLDGASNRLALGFGAYRGEGAISFNYSRRVNHYDMGLAAGFSGKDSLAKAGIGVSW